MTRSSVLSLLADHQRWRELRHTVGKDVSDFIVQRETDPDLLTRLEEPFESVDDVRTRLEWTEEHLLTTDDRRAVFLTVYTEMTAVTIREIRADTFADSEWMKQYVIRFAEYYRRALLGYERGDIERVPDPWIVALSTALRSEALVVQDAFLGINAHINVDLALTLSNIGVTPNRSRKYADHNRINRILERLVAVQQELLSERYAPGLERVGDRLGELDVLGASVGLASARETAWRVAVVRSDARWSAMNGFTSWLLNRSATGAAYLLLKPDADPSTMRLLRDIEADEFDLERYAKQYHERVRSAL